jgi:hypothetical protein
MWCKHIYSCFLSLIFIVASYCSSSAYFCSDTPQLLPQVSQISPNRCPFSPRGLQSFCLLYMGQIRCSLFVLTAFSLQIPIFYYTIPLLASSVYNSVPKHFLPFEHWGRRFEPHLGHGYPCAFILCALLCVGSGHATGWSPSKESYRLCIRLRNWKKSCQGPTKGFRAIDEWVKGFLVAAAS